MYLTRGPTLNHDSQIFAISLRHMGATVLSKDEKEQRIYRVLLIEVPLYGVFFLKKKYIFCFSTYTVQTEKACAGRVHTCSDGRGQSIHNASLARRCALSLLNADDA